MHFDLKCRPCEALGDLQIRVCKQQTTNTNKSTTLISQQHNKHKDRTTKSTTNKQVETTHQ